jgi:hypothetical protein
MIDLQAELKQRIQALYEIALDFLSEEEARDLFCSVTKRRRGKRGLGRNPNPRPTKETKRKRDAREPRMEIERVLTEADLTDLRKSDQLLIDRMDGIADKK